MRKVCLVILLSFILWADDSSKAQKAFDRGDFVKAVQLWESLVQQGNSDAQYQLGVMYYNGWGVNRDINKTIKLYTLASQQRNATAQYNLGMIYYHGIHVKQDYHKAYKLYSLAAKKGEPNAQKVIDLLCKKKPLVCNQQ